jgi:hypothetical protein
MEPVRGRRTGKLWDLGARASRCGKHGSASVGSFNCRGAGEASLTDSGSVSALGLAEVGSKAASFQYGREDDKNSFV